MQPTQNPTAPAADTDDQTVITPADILRGAALYLIEHGWTQGDYYAKGNDEPFPPCCAVGAISMACTGRRLASPHDMDDAARRDFTRAVDFFTDYVARLEPAPAFLDVEYSPFIWNDAPGRHGLHVVIALNAAATDWDTTHGGTR